MTADVAGASSDCATLRRALNNKRAASMTVETDAKLIVVERLLQNPTTEPAWASLREA